jgi:hypothetical protein
MICTNCVYYKSNKYCDIYGMLFPHEHRPLCSLRSEKNICEDYTEFSIPIWYDDDIVFYKNGKAKIIKHRNEFIKENEMKF